MNNPERVGHLTSSKIHVICKSSSRDKASPITGVKWSAPALTYFEEKRIERRLGKCLDTDGYSRPAAWGNFAEIIVFSKLGVEYQLQSQDSIEHPDAHFKDIWSGSRDVIVPNVKIGEIKCYQLKKFAQYTDALNLKVTKDFTIEQKIQNLKDNFSEEYWQMVSNAILNKTPKAEAISFAPYESELPILQDFARNWDGPDQWKYSFIANDEPKNLPLIKDDGYYKDLNKFEFTVPQEDIDYLTERVDLARDEIIVE